MSRFPESPTTTLPTGFRAKVHFNLNQPGPNPHKFVIKPLDPHPRKGKVLEYVQTVVLRDCVTKVSEATRLSIVKLGQRAVCAWCIGKVSHDTPDTAGWHRVEFNPYLHSQFTNVSTGKPVTSAPTMVFRAEGKRGFFLIPPTA